MRGRFRKEAGALLLTMVLLVGSIGDGRIVKAITTQKGDGRESYQWNSVNIGGGGFVTGVISTSEDNIFYARTDVGGAYKLDTDTGKWTMLSGGLTQDHYGGLGVDSVAVDPENADNVYIFCGYTYVSTEPSLLMRSTDGGKTFTYTELPFQSYGNGKARNVGERLVVDPLATNVLYCATRKDGVWKSEDYGATWSKIRENDGTTDSVGTCMVMTDSGHPVDGKSAVYIADWKNSNQIYKYNGTGTSWTALDCSNISGAYPQRCEIYGGKAYITFADTDFENGPAYGFLGVLDFATDTISKIEVTYNNTKYPLSGISIDQSGSGKMIVSTLNTYERLFWNDPPNPEWGEDWGTAILTSEDGGQTWTNVNQTKMLYLQDGGKEWVRDEKPHWSGDVTFLPNDPTKAILTSGNGTYMLSNLFAGASETKVYAAFYTEGMEETVVLDMVAPASGSVMLANVAYDAGGFIHSNVQRTPSKRLGTSVDKDSNECVNDKGVAIDKTGIAVCEADPSLMVCCGETETTSGTIVAPFQYSTDSGATWYDIPGASSYGERGSCAISADGSTIYWMPTATSDRYTENVGKMLCIFSFNKETGIWGNVESKDVTGSVLSGARVMTDTVNADIVYVSSNEGLYYSTDRGATFTKIASSDTGRLNRMTVVPGKEGIVYEANGRWSSQSLSIYDITKGTNRVVGNVAECEAVGFGKAAEGKEFPTIYIWGTVNEATGLFRSIDEGESWIQINDSNTMFGGPGNGKMLLGDRRIFGRVYMTTYGQGIVYGDALGDGSSEESSEITSETTGSSEESSESGSSETTTEIAGSSEESSESGSSEATTEIAGSSEESSESGSSEATTEIAGSSEESSESGSSEATTEIAGSSEENSESGSSEATTEIAGSSEESSESGSSETTTEIGETGTIKTEKTTEVAGNQDIVSTESSNHNGKRLSAPKSLKVISKTKKRVVLTWKKVAGARKYKIYYATKKKGTYKLYITTTKNKVLTSKKMKSGKVFYFRVAAIGEDGMVGKVTQSKKVKIK